MPSKFDRRWYVGHGCFWGQTSVLITSMFWFTSEWAPGRKKELSFRLPCLLFVICCLFMCTLFSLSYWGRFWESIVLLPIFLVLVCKTKRARAMKLVILTSGRGNYAAAKATITSRGIWRRNDVMYPLELYHMVRTILGYQSCSRPRLQQWSMLLWITKASFNQNLNFWKPKFLNLWSKDVHISYFMSVSSYANY